MSVFETQIKKAGSDCIYVLTRLTEADLPERLIRLILLHEERKIRMLVCTVVEHILEVSHDMLFFEEKTLVF